MTTKIAAYPEVVIQPASRVSTEGRHAPDIKTPLDLQEKLLEIVDTGKTRATEWKGRLQDDIREKPIQSVLIAAAIGAAIALIVGRRR